MYLLRPLTIRDVVRAVKQRKLRVAFGITRCLASNGVNAVRFRLRRYSHLHVRRAGRGTP